MRRARLNLTTAEAVNARFVTDAFFFFFFGLLEFSCASFNLVDLSQASDDDDDEEEEAASTPASSEEESGSD